MGKPSSKKKRQEQSAEARSLAIKYLGAAILLGIIEGVVTYFFLVGSTPPCSQTFNGFSNDPLSLLPYMIGMLVVALLAFYVALMHNDAVNAYLFISFLFIWGAVGFGLYIMYVPVYNCPMIPV
jgi:ABC-type molybdate transport system permease subunit